MTAITASLPSVLSRLRRCRRGATALEFGLVAGPFLAVCIVIIEIGWQLTTASLLDASVLRASRFGAVGLNTPTTRPAGMPTDRACRNRFIPWYISHTSNGFLAESRVIVAAYSASSVSSFAQITTPPPPQPPPEPPPQGWTAPAADFGGGGAVVRYDVAFRQPFLTLYGARLLGLPNAITHRATFIVKNEPFDDVPC